MFPLGSADQYIEQETRRLREEGRSVRVATDDRAIDTACTSYGASVASAKRFVQELKASREVTAAVVADFNAR